jgi:foldase protein PrsA
MQLSQEYKGRELESKLAAGRSEMLNRLIEDRLILQEANKEKVTYDASRAKARLEEIKKRYNSETEFQQDLMRQGLTQSDIEKRIKEQFLMFLIVDSKVRSKVSVDPDEVTEFYEQHKNDFVSEPIRQLDAYAFADEGAARSFANGLKSGRSVEELAKKYPFTLNQITTGNGVSLKKEIDEAVANVGLNEESLPVRIEGKYYVFKVNSIVPSKQLTLSEAQNEIHAYLLEKKSQEKLKSWLDELKKKSYIQIR